MWKKLIAIILLLALIPTYIVVVYAAPTPSESSCDTDGRVPGENVGFCSEVSMEVIRGYYLDTVRLPVTAFGINVDIVNKTFLPLILVIAGLVWRR